MKERWWDNVYDKKGDGNEGVQSPVIPSVSGNWNSDKVLPKVHQGTDGAYQSEVGSETVVCPICGCFYCICAG